MSARTAVERGGPARWSGNAIPLRTVHLLVAGATGKVGRHLLALLAAEAPRLREEEGVELRVEGAFGRTRHFRAPGGVLPGDVPARLPDAGAFPLAAALEEPGPSASRIFVDCTASPAVAARYSDVVGCGLHLVTANKVGWSAHGDGPRRLREQARVTGVELRYETAVGATLPLLAPSRALRRAGDVLHSAEGVLSGTLGFIFGRLREGGRLSQAVREAREAGYTEPHPRDDLTGADVGRKLLILLREWGVEPERVEVEPLVPESPGEPPDAENFLRGLEEEDASWAARVEAARARGEVLAYVARFQDGAARVGVEALPADHPLAGLQGTENRVVLHTRFFQPTPLTISGPGAGVELTAGGVLADILEIAARVTPPPAGVPR